MSTYQEGYKDGREQGRKDCEQKLVALRSIMRTIVQIYPDIGTTLEQVLLDIKQRDGEP